MRTSRKEDKKEMILTSVLPPIIWKKPFLNATLRYRCELVFRLLSPIIFIRHRRPSKLWAKSAAEPSSSGSLTGLPKAADL
jgi:hypothetical protein